VVVFNFPEGIPSLTCLSMAAPSLITIYCDFHIKATGSAECRFPVIVHPMDKADNYIKRCVAISGDEIQVKNGSLFVNKKPQLFRETLKQNI